MTSLTTFHLFTQLPLDLRNEIWALTLPGPRIIHVVPDPATPPRHGHKPDTSTTYRATRCSWGAQQSVALSVCRESRAEALRYMTPRFNCYWNFRTDFLYVEVGHGERAELGMELVDDMRLKGLLDGVRNLALDWHVCGPGKQDYWCASSEVCSGAFEDEASERFATASVTALRSLLDVKRCVFVFRVAPRNVVDILNPGVAWELAPVTHWCDARRQSEKNITECLAADKVEKAKEWEARRSTPEITWNQISERKFGDSWQNLTY